MKKLILFSLVLVTLFSCQETSNPENSMFSREWVFSGYQSSWSADMNFHPISDSLYIYRFNENGSFTKFLGTYELSGSYELKEDPVNQREYMLLEYSQSSYQLHQDSDGFPLIHSCSPGSETLTFQDSNTLTGSWNACDGPILFFTKE
ncbi:hypothetical protein [Algoriphagus sp. CAU 1675]|uniref:hypothetical protein n=1 Tax=Algoriphagus sp. CAU 1675 TaxID=3032597 RepID=UPI0023DAF5F4|nr:hypothetical protein [Algoriphagus sp. CAU 1675]MDF2156385.1 hypothetical protein [Algoriphagus sp. CAU 1675]